MERISVMKKTFICLMIVLILALSSGSAISRYSIEVTGEMWMEWPPQLRTVYLWGFLKGMDHVFKELWGRSITTATPGFYIQSPEMVYLYLQAHPEYRPRPMERIILDALKGHLVLWNEKDTFKNKRPNP
jgi:hypothetical protein